MKKWIFLLTALSLISGIRSLNAQATYLLAPTMYSVTVDPETGFDVITWIASPSPEIDYYVIGIAVQTLPGQPVSYIPAGTVSATETTFVNPNSGSASHSIGYAVWGVDDQGGTAIFRGPFSKTDSTMYLTAVLDSCAAKIDLTWNAYNGWAGSVDHYNIVRWTGPGATSVLGTTTGSTTKFSILNVPIGELYNLYIEAVHTDGVRTSQSNMVNIFTQMSHLPAFINADYATLGNGYGIDLSFTVDPLSDLTHYIIQRSDNPAGPFTTLTELQTTSKHISYTDNIAFTSGIRYYQIEAVNSCGNSGIRSNMANNIILNGTYNNNAVNMTWNAYHDWKGGLERYRVIRTRGRTNPTVDTLNNFLLTEFSESLAGMIDYSDPQSSYLCYQVEAVERMNIYGVRGRSLSNQVCFSMYPEIIMPNAFIPNDPEPENSTFSPVFSFNPEHYEMIVYNRLGTMVWEGSGPWDGRSGGAYVPEGVYVYLIRIFNYSSDIREVNGSVTVLYR